jgi:uncharacterized protein (DUF342 family)
VNNGTIIKRKKVFAFNESAHIVKNPLEQYCAVEERSDGLYIKVLREQKDSIHPDWVQRALDEVGVMNFDLERFTDVVQRGRGLFEKIGQNFEYFDPELELYIQVFVNPLKASCKVNSSFAIAGKKLNLSSLGYYLKRKGVKHGLKTEVLQDILSNERYDTVIDIASSTPPVNGLDARIELKISVNPDLKPQLRNDGGVDYRGIQSFTSVVKGQLLAVKVPPTAGKPGTAVSGESISPNPGMDVALPGGKNTEADENGMKLTAAKSGIIYYENGVLHIVEVLHINSNVDFAVGNIKYSGDVFVKGNVLPGFTVEADGLVHIQGEVESAKIISRNSTVVIEKGIHGKGDTTISAKKGIQIVFAQDTTLITEGPIFVRQYILHCNCICESLEANAQSAQIIGGEIRAEKYILARQIGNETVSSTKIYLYDKKKNALEEKVKELGVLETKLKSELEPIERQLRTKAALLKKRTEEVTDRVKDEIKKWVDAYNSLNQKISYVQQKVKEIRATLNSPAEYSGYIEVTGKIFPGTECDLYGVKFPIVKLMPAKKYSLVNNTIHCEG